MAPGNDPSEFFKAFLFINIFRAFRMAIHPRKMVIAFIAVLLGVLFPDRLGTSLHFRRLVVGFILRSRPA